MILVDSILTVFILFLSFALRLGSWSWPRDELFWVIFCAPLIVIPIFISFRLYSSVVRYIGFQALWSIAQAVTMYSALWGLIVYMFGSRGIPILFGVPRSVIIINWLLCIVIIISSRVFARWLFTRETVYEHNKKTNVMIYGAGSTGMQLSNALQLSKKYNHIAFIDDDDTQEGSYLNGIPVYSFGKISSIIDRNNITEVLLAMPSISRIRRREIIESLSSLPLQVRSLPSLSKLAEGKIKIDDLLEIDIGDLLGRESVQANDDLLRVNITDKVVMVTGAGGSIGSELCRQIIPLMPNKLVLFEVSESSLYQIEQELSSIKTSIEIAPVLGSVRDFSRMQNILNHYEVQTIYHAAAYKHVPLVEYNQSQGLLNNSIGTLVAVEAAISENVETFVLISTDKAVRPTSIMGASKRIAELVLQAYAEQQHNTCLTMVRFGNVLDSSGSVIPLFKKQIKSGGPVTVTNANVVRYFMTIQEAVELVIQAGAMGQGGDVFMIDMGEPVKIFDLAVKMINLSGLQVLDNNNHDGDIEIIFTGLRPGEKLYEELIIAGNITETENKLIMRVQEEMIGWEIIKPILNELQEASTNQEATKIEELLIKLVPEYDAKVNNSNSNSNTNIN